MENNEKLGQLYIFQEEIVQLAKKEKEERKTAHWQYPGFNPHDLGMSEMELWGKFKTMESELWPLWKEEKITREELSTNPNFITREEFDAYMDSIYGVDKNGKIVVGKMLPDIPVSRGHFCAALANKLMKYWH